MTRARRRARTGSATPSCRCPSCARCAARARTGASPCSRAADPAAIYRAEGSADAVLPALVVRRRRARRAAGRFDEVWLLPNSLPRGADSRPPRERRARIGYATDRRGALLTGALPPPPGTAAPAPRLRRPARRARRRARSRSAAAAALPDAALGRAREALVRAGRRGGRALRRALPRERLRPDEALARRALRRRSRTRSPAGDSPPPSLVGPGEEDLGRSVASAAAIAARPSSARSSIRSSSRRRSRSRARVVTTTPGRCTSPAPSERPSSRFFGPTDPGPHRPVRIARRASSTATSSARPASRRSARTGTSACGRLRWRRSARAVEELIDLVVRAFS